jgi:hypothetical protein
MKKKIVNALLMVALVAPSVGSLVSCKDYNEDLKTEVDGEIASLRKTLQDQINSLTDLVKSINSCKCDLSLYLSKKEAEENYVNKADFLAEINALKLADQNLQKLIDEINAKLANFATKDEVASQISELNAFILQVKATADEALELAKAGKCTCDFTEINNKLKALDDEIKGWNDRLKEVNTTATTALAKAENNYLWVIANKKSIDSLSNITSDLEGRVKVIEDNYMKKDSILKIVQEAKEAAAEAKQLATDAMTKAVDAYNLADNAKQKADQNEIKINELEESLKNYVTKTEFNEKMTEVEGKIKKVSDKVEALELQLNILKKDLSNMITGIITQATANPVLGYLKTPFGIDQYLLAAYYGAADNGIEFPARDGKYYLEASDVETWTPRNLEVMGVSNLKNVEGYFTKQDERFVADIDGDYTGNAGSVYVTVNPSNVNFEGKTLGLETSAQNASPFALTPLEYSNDELELGWYRNVTRGAENGFYKAQATLTPENIDKAKLVIDFKSIGSAIKSVIKDGPQDSRTRISMAEAAAKIMQSLEADIPAYGLKASWTDEANNQTHNYFSQYNIGVIAIKPLSFAFLKDKTWKHVDGFDRMRSVVSRVIKEVVVYRPDFASYEFKFKSIELGKNISVDKNGQILAQVYYLKNDGSESDPVLIPIEDVFGDLTPTITELVDAIRQNCADDSEVNVKLAEFFNEVKATNNFQTYIDLTKESVYEAIDKYLTRIEEHILRIMNNAHRTLYITMFGKQTDGNMALLSNSLDAPSKSKTAELTLIPTTYTMQFFAPIYKKFVAVTNVYDAATGEELDLADAKALAAEANAGDNMFKVVDGMQNCSIKGEKGMIYELTYTAVDYLGVVMIKKFYVEF